MSDRTLQDPAAPMKRALFRALLIGAVAAVLYMFCVQPCQSALQTSKAELAKLQEQQRAMVRDLNGADQVKSRLSKLDSELSVHTKRLLEPPLGSTSYYQMSAKTILDPLAADVGLLITDYAELPVRLLPLPKPQATQLYARKPIRITCTGSYAKIVSFLMRVEQQLPQVALEAFTLKTQKNADRQSATLVLEWPIKGVNTAAANGGVKK